MEAAVDPPAYSEAPETHLAAVEASRETPSRADSPLECGPLSRI